MPIALGVVMDPISAITTAKDSSFAMLLEAQRRGWDVWYMQQADLSLRDGQAVARMQQLRVHDDTEHWFEFGDSRTAPLSTLNVVLMRKDPPFDMEYIATT